jgi:hypothetical protein
VRDRIKEATMANTTAMAMGTNRKPATPCIENIGTKATQMQSSETKAGLGDLARAVHDGVIDALPCSRCQLMFSMVTVASSTRCPPPAPARPGS